MTPTPAPLKTTSEDINEKSAEHKFRKFNVLKFF